MELSVVYRASLLGLRGLGALFEKPHRFILNDDLHYRFFKYHLRIRLLGFWRLLVTY